MRSRHVGMTESSMIFGATFRFLSTRAAVSIIALTVGLAASSPGFSQTISLGQAGQNTVFEAAMPGVNPGTVSISNSSVNGSVGSGADSFLYTSTTTIGGSVYQDSNATFGQVTTTIGGGTYTGTDLSQAATDAANASANAAALSPNNSFSNNSITGTSSMNVVNFDQGLTLNGATLTINGTSSQQFVFNFSQDLSLLNTTIVLNGVSASNVFFNIIGGDVAIKLGTFSGTILDQAGISGNEVDIDQNTFSGKIISDGDISILDSTIIDTSIAPELSTIVMAGFACAFVLGNAGRNLLRRRWVTLAVAPTSS